MMEIKNLFNGVQRKKDFSMDLGSSGLETLLAASSDFFQTPLLTRQQSYGIFVLANLLPGTCYSPSSKPLCITPAPLALRQTHRETKQCSCPWLFWGLPPKEC